MKRLQLLLAAAGLIGTQACVKVPADVDYISPGAGYNQTTFEPVLGRTSLLPGDPQTNIFNADHSTLPLTFKVMNVRTAAGEPVDIFNKTFPVLVWKEAYTGLEKTREEIEKKRTIEEHHLFEVREHSGQFVMWTPIDPAYLNAVKVQPDPGYRFDVEVSNSGGTKMIRNMELKPLRQQPYEPNTIDPVTGNSYGTNNPNLVVNIKAKNSDYYMGNSAIKLIFYKDPKSTGNSLTFEFRDSSYNPIDPKMFGDTKWEEVVHHFGAAQFAPDGVTYDVAYPVPLTPLPTRYTNNLGNRAHVQFSYSRIGVAGIRETALLGTDLAIYEPGNWRVIFWFWARNPDFSNN
ncbi:DUF5007 domain-containing protein [Chitinophaga vietnamensis]|uniref:DUF5007 domain-containing protein n=1 Tax=Chitinophaga vietnamensis TaxID=2593957 RepID=UPI00117826CF|nr:DUF5007 domain-containing protein [Chitinophaga vietnamensis]